MNNGLPLPGELRPSDATRRRAGDLRDPRADRASGRVVRVESFQNVKRDLLGDVFGVNAGTVSRRGVQVPPQRQLVQIGLCSASGSIPL